MAKCSGLLKQATALERIQYGFDRANNRLYCANMVASGGQDEYYTYDTLYPLLSLQRGTLNSGRTAITGTPARQEDFTLDPTGNWNTFVMKVMGATTLNQGRTHSKANAITAINGSSTYIQEDLAGNTVLAPQVGNWLAACQLVYDAWNRLVSVSTASGGGSSSSSSSSSGGGPTSVAVYEYDGLNRRQSKTASGTVRGYYYTQSWQIVEERLGASTTA